MANWSGEGMIAVNPSNPLNLVAGGVYQAPASWNNTSVWKTLGVSGAFTSFDGGRTWLVQELPELPQFTNTSSPQCGHVHLADSVLAFGPNDTAYYVDMSYYSGDPSVSCTASLAGTGLYVTVSRDGGVHWQTPKVVAGAGSGGSIDKPWVAVDPRSGEAYIAYTDDANGSQIYLQRSNDSGANWSSPKPISSGTDSLRGVELAVDAGGGVDASWVDQNTAAIYFCRSNNSGASFSSPKVIATGQGEYANPSPDAFRAYMLPGLGVDTSAQSPHVGQIYVVWQNGTGATSGSPFVSLVTSSDNGSHWSSAVVVDHRSTEDFQPDVAAGPDGTVYVEWYGENSTTGHYRLYGAVSANGGTTFSPAIPVSDADSYPQYPSTGGGNAWWIGDYTDAVSEPNGAWAYWTDARSPLAWSCSPCLWGYVYNISFYAAEMTRITLSASIPVNASITGAAPLLSPVLLENSSSAVPGLVGGNYSISVPSNVTVNGSTYYFALWYGTTISSGPNLTGALAGPVGLRACYTPVPQGRCTEAGAPGQIALKVAPSNATVRVDGSIVPVGPDGTVLDWEAPGVHRLTVSARDFVTQRKNVSVTEGQTTTLAFRLVAVPGILQGTVSPTSSALSLTPNGTVARLANGAFTASLPPGHYLLTAQRSGFTSVAMPVSIFANNTTWANFTLPLVPPGTLQGTIGPAGAAATLNGTPIALGPSGTFALVLAPGTYWVNATAPGYVAQSSGPIEVSSGVTTSITLLLSPYTGTVTGVVDPPTADVSVNGTAVPVVNASFTVSLTPGTYSVSASAAGFVPQTLNVSVGGGDNYALSIQLGVSNGWLKGEVVPATATLTLSGRSVALRADGTFNVSAAPGGYRVVVTAAGYATYAGSVTIQAGRAEVVQFALAAPGPSETNGWVAVGPYVTVGLVLVAVAILAVLVQFRRRRTPPPSAARGPPVGSSPTPRRRM